MIELGAGEICLRWCLEVQRRFTSMKIEAYLISVFSQRQKTMTANMNFPILSYRRRPVSKLFV